MAEDIPQSSRDKVRKRARHRCERCGVPVPHGHWHHRRTRAVRDALTHHWSNGVYLCAPCHRWVHANPVDARNTGFIVSRWQETPGSVPVKLWRGWHFLTDDGGYLPEQEGRT